MTPDALSSAFNLLDLRSTRATRFEAAGDWSFRFPAKAALKFSAVLRGACWLLHQGQSPVRLREGDAFLLSYSPPYVLASDPDLAPEDGLAVFDGGRSNIGRYRGDDLIAIASTFHVNALHEHLLSRALPTLLVVPHDAPSASVMMATLQILAQEFGAEGIGADLMRRHLADILLVQLLRAFAGRETVNSDDAFEPRSNWIGALADPRLGASLDAVHAEPGSHWTVGLLAERAGMSRSAFAETFRKSVGLSPMDYLLGLRMQIAEDLLQQGWRVSEVADELGYASQSAFGVAFKRIKGGSPRSITRSKGMRTSTVQS